MRAPLILYHLLLLHVRQAMAQGATSPLPLLSRQIWARNQRHLSHLSLGCSCVFFLPRGAATDASPHELEYSYLWRNDYFLARILYVPRKAPICWACGIPE